MKTNQTTAVKTMRLQAGYVAHTGHVFTQEQADAYNRFTDDIERATYAPTVEILKDQRHRYFVDVTTHKQVRNPTPWVVVSNPGQDDEDIVADFATVPEARACIRENPGADLMKRLDSGVLTTEY